MPLLQAILQKVKSTDSIRYPSPPPELEEERLPRRKKYTYKYAHIRAKVDNRPPFFDPRILSLQIPKWSRNLRDTIEDNFQLLAALRNRDIRGKVDHYWTVEPIKFRCYYENRVNFYKRVARDNKVIYKRICSTGPKVESAQDHARDWARNRRNIIERAEAKFVLFPPVYEETMEDQAFLAPEGVKRPRVSITLGIKDSATIGELHCELFTDVSPRTCQLFLELLEGDGLGHTYVGTRFFTKVPGLYWSGGDVIHDNGFGCYAQRGRSAPIGAENYHFSHTMPGLLTMRVTRDDEMCGIFSITFKPLQQFDLKNVVFGRVIRPSSTFNCISKLGAPLSPQPLVQIRAARLRPRRCRVKISPIL